ncbi:tetratricopeptide repeat protein [Streptomyces sp. NPDC002054]|uniref:tetratricopeptide repeat protein n=1 Tax=Streptomyces sp. NPDC002054 TaxID=3154663 RepID=UPI00331AC883
MRSDGSAERENSIRGGTFRMPVIQAGGDVTVHYANPDGPVPPPGPVVSTAPPFGLRDPGRPLRGRHEELDRLTRLLSGPSDGTVHVLCGPGGSGKTALALEVAHRVPFRRWWIDARHRASLEAGLLAVARRLGAPLEHGTGDPADGLWDRLTHLGQPWLLVVDNADDPAVLDGNGRLADGTGWVRPHLAPYGHVIVTSRDAARSSWGAASTQHRLGVLGEEDAARVLLDHAGPRAGGPADAAGLARRLGGLPLALYTAGRYLAEATAVPDAFRDATVPTAFAAYRETLDARPELLDPDGSLASTWELSLDLLDRRGLPRARGLLGLLSVFADAPVPYVLLLHPPTLAAEDGFTGFTGFTGLDGPGLWSHLRATADFGLLDLPAPEGDAPHLLYLHPLVRAFNADRSLLPLAVRLLSRAAGADRPADPTDPADPADPAYPHEARRRPDWNVLAAHARHLARRAVDTDAADAVVEPALTAALGAAVHHRDNGLFQQAHADIEFVRDAAERRWDREHPVVLAAAHARATTLRTMGRLREAEDGLREVVEVRRRTSGDRHPATLAARHDLGAVLNSLARRSEARAEFELVLRARVELLGERHPVTLRTRHRLARVLFAQGAYAESLAEFDAVLAGPGARADDPATLTTRHHRARVLLAQGDMAEATAEFEALLRDRRRLLGPDHPLVTTTRHNLALAFLAQGRSADAERELCAVLLDQRKVFGERHYYTLATRHELARAVFAQGRHEEAESETALVLAAQREVLGDDHSYTLATRHTHAETLAASGRTAEATAELAQVLARRTRTLGADHPQTGATRTALHAIAPPPPPGDEHLRGPGAPGAPGCVTPSLPTS